MKLGQVQTEAGALAVAYDDVGARYLTCGRSLTAMVRDQVPLRDLPLGAPVDDLTLARPLAPVSPGMVIAVGLNYLDHIKETGLQEPATPLLFAKLPSSVVGPGAAIVIDPDITTQVDWEVELAVVIGRRCWQVPAEQALDHVAGYTVANDVSARDLQFADGQWLRGKGLPTFCPLGPVLVTPDEIADPQDLELRTRVNGETVQSSCTGLMVFPVAELIEFCSHHFVLEPGDVLLTGTPWGCGGFMTPPRYLQPGDTVEVEVEHIGILTNPVTGPIRR